MDISIITPHFNHFEGLKQIYLCLSKQSNPAWEWVVVDDLSDKEVREDLENYFKNLADDRIQLILNVKKSNASICRNIGAEKSRFSRLVFLDADDLIAPDFIAKRAIDYIDFAVFKNTAVINKNGTQQIWSTTKENYLSCFLQARFIWPITSILWDKDFFKAVGKFHPELPRLQDVELSIRALQKSSNYSIINNTVDFYYQVKPIRERKNFVKPVCEAVYLFISELLDTSELIVDQKKVLSGYYYLCTKYFERSESFEDVALVRKNLKMFYKLRYIFMTDYLLGALALKLYTNKLLSGKAFLKVNRYLFKTKIEARG